MAIHPCMLASLMHLEVTHLLSGDTLLSLEEILMLLDVTLLPLGVTLQLLEETLMLLEGTHLFLGATLLPLDDTKIFLEVIRLLLQSTLLLLWDSLLYMSDKLLPAGWEESITQTGRPFFVNHATRATQWERPQI